MTKPIGADAVQDELVALQQVDYGDADRRVAGDGRGQVTVREHRRGGIRPSRLRTRATESGAFCSDGVTTKTIALPSVERSFAPRTGWARMRSASSGERPGPAS
jgi:hypothetical protein